MIRQGRMMTIKTGMNITPRNTAATNAINAIAIAIGKRTTVINILHREHDGPKI